MKLAPQSRDILRQYKALINARRRDAGQRELTTAQVMDEICEYMTCQCAVYIGGHFILQGKGTINHRAGEPLPLPAARKPGQAAPAGETSPRLRRRALSSPLSVAVAPEFAYYQGYLPVKQTGKAYVKVEYRLFSKEEQDKVAVDKVAAAVAWQERMNKPVVPELVEREQPEHLREYFHERLRVHRLNSQQLPRANAPEYNKPGDDQQN